MNPKNPVLIMNEYLNTLQSYERSQFPLEEPECNIIEKESGKIKISIGLKAQGMFCFVERAIDDGMGWKQIGHSIGWVGFAVLRSYYTDLYRDLYAKMGLIMIDCNEKPYIGREVYDQTTNKLEITKETIERNNEPFSSLRNTIDTVQFLVKDKNLFDKSSKEIPPVYMVENNEPTNICYHTTLVKGESVMVTKSISFYNLLTEIVEMKFKGWEQKGKVYYDLIELDEDKKYYVRDKFVNNLLSLNFSK